jgi:hypothetical protein
VAEILEDKGFLLRLARTSAVIVLGIMTPVCAAALLGVIVSILKPPVEMFLLHRVSVSARTASFVFVIVCVPVFVTLEILSNKLPGFKTDAWVTSSLSPLRLVFVGRILSALCFAMMLVSPFRYVRPEGHKWISTGRAGEWEVSQSVAWDYLWRSIRFNDLMILCIGLLLASAAIEIFRDAQLFKGSHQRTTHCAGEE